MKSNIGTVDKYIRIVLAIIFVVMGFALSPWWFILAAIAIVTAAVDWCGLYSIFGWSTKSLPKSGKKRKKK